jgi:Domain of unknown function (DUF4864)
MRLPALFLALLLALPAQAQEQPIRDVIESQIEAFEADDFAAAFSFASPTIKAIFGTPENFGKMVREGYPMVYRPAEVRMLDLREISGNLWQTVRIVDPEGRAFLLDYMMIETPEGWQINAVEIRPEPEVSA